MPARHPPVRLSGHETARVERLAREWTVGLLSIFRVAFELRWSTWRGRHQARARWYYYSTRASWPTGWTGWPS